MVVDAEHSERVAPLDDLVPLRSLVSGSNDAMRLLDGVWLVDEARLLDVTHGVVVTEAGHGFDADRGELWFSGAAAEAVMLELESRRRALADEAVELEARAQEAERASGEAAVAAEQAEAAFGEVAHLRERVLDGEVLGRLVRGAGALEEQLARSAARCRHWRHRLRRRSRRGRGQQASSARSCVGSPRSSSRRSGMRPTPGGARRRRRSWSRGSVASKQS